MLKKFIAVFVLSSFFLAGALASHHGTFDENVQIPFIPSLGGSVLQQVPETEAVQFMEVKAPVVFEEPELNTNDKMVSAPSKVVPMVSEKKPYRPYIYGASYFSLKGKAARVQDLEEAFGKAPRSLYSDNQRSSRINALYGRLARERYYPSLREARIQVAGVYEYDARLLTQEKN